MGPPLLHWLSDRPKVVADLGHTPRSPVPRFRTPSAPPLGGVRLSLTRAVAFELLSWPICCRVLARSIPASSRLAFRHLLSACRADPTGSTRSNTMATG